MHFLVIDTRFGVPNFVFLECEPGQADRPPGPRGKWVTLEAAATAAPAPGAGGFASRAAIGCHPERPDRYSEFASDGHVRAAGFTLIEPRYVGPNWETYCNVFHPEGGKHMKHPARRLR